ncbi:MAG: hypothetical protein WB952_20360 [Terriglobales bacterium]
MTLEALLTFFGILVAVVAIARPVQRLSLRLFVPAWRLGAALLLSLALIVCRDAPFGVRPPFGWPLDNAMFGLTLGAFAIPVLAALWGWASWDRASLGGNRMGRVENVFKAALREREFDEVERIVRKNQDRLEQLPANASSVLFNPAMVAALVDSHSLVHLELLANLHFLRSLENRHGAVDVVVRELLHSGVSPLRAAVVSKYGGLEHLTYSASERDLMEKTFQNPEWYFEASAHYPLVISAVEALRSGKLDIDYNDVGRDYEADQGISKRCHRPVYLAVKTEVLAIEAALEKRVDKDFYVSDLFDVFRAVQERSELHKAVWESPLSNHEFPTPYAYLLYTVAVDLDDLSCQAVQEATHNSSPARAGAPGDVARALALSWSFCVWSIADSPQQVTPEFRTRIIEQYLVFMLKLGWQASEIYFGPVGNVEGLHVWRDLFLRELKARFWLSDPLRTAALRNAMNSLDHGKGYVIQGYTWLEKELFGND